MRNGGESALRVCFFALFLLKAWNGRGAFGGYYEGFLSLRECMGVDVSCMRNGIVI